MASLRAGRHARLALVIGIAGLPLWWFLGVSALLPLIAVPMAVDLWTRGQVRLPRHFGWWLLFLGWVLLGLGTLGAVAPGAEESGGRLMVFGYRFYWYLAITIVLVWLGNTSREKLPDRVVYGLFAWVFVVTTAGGLLGLLAPDLGITTLAERLTPAGLRSNNFVHSMIAAETADVQQVLGDPRARPKAPFPFTNTWGSVMALSLVFLVCRARDLAPVWRWIAVAVGVLAAVPVVASLNRGLWLTLAVSGIGVLVLLSLRHRHAALAALVGVVLALGVLLPSTSLGDTVASRLENPHSNERRGQLVEATVNSMTQGSPVVGFGGTRDVQGSFASIAGGSTPECPACGVPPLGTQGQLWLVLFSQGWLGGLFFLTFFLLTLTRTWRCRTTNEAAATFAMGTFLVQLAIYDTLGLSQLMVMVAVALVWREQSEKAGARDAVLRVPRLRDMTRVGALALGGAALGAATLTGHTVQERSTVAVELTSTPTYLATGTAARPSGAETEIDTPRPTSIDTEAALLRSEGVLAEAGRRVHLSAARLRETVGVTAPSNSSVLEVSVTTGATRDPRTAALAVVGAYLTERQHFLELRRTDLIADLTQQLANLDPADALSLPARTYLVNAIEHLRAGSGTVGRVIRVDPPRALAPDPRVPVSSGAALGLLIGVVVLHLAPTGRSRR
ncbi:hypothetical protein KG112_08720 [Nocardioides sp. zg-ZUI104]|uniref:hypothetical protein n=1 Tax=Nocardioides faecalis TaxID=2803858 RepID=UPI001BCC4D49|nr:hypothetical protein [Nocardioides faecalis]MBS4752887.1 hypothetical protein [Nocardioides faecalis]